MISGLQGNTVMVNGAEDEITVRNLGEETEGAALSVQILGNRRQVVWIYAFEHRTIPGRLQVSRVGEMKLGGLDPGLDPIEYFFLNALAK